MRAPQNLGGKHGSGVAVDTAPRPPQAAPRRLLSLGRPDHDRQPRPRPQDKPAKPVAVAASVRRKIRGGSGPGEGPNTKYPRAKPGVKPANGRCRRPHDDSKSSGRPDHDRQSRPRPRRQTGEAGRSCGSVSKDVGRFGLGEAPNTKSKARTAAGRTGRPDHDQQPVTKTQGQTGGSRSQRFSWR